MKKQFNLSTKRLDIKTLRVSQISQEYIDGLNDVDVNKFLLTPRQVKQTEQTVREFVLDNLNSASSVLFGLFFKPTGHLIGTFRVHNISYFHYSCAVGICLFDKSYWGRGLGQETLKKMVHFIFNELKMHYIEAGMYYGNDSSIQLFKNCGFERIVTYRDKYRYDEHFRAVTFFGKTNRYFNMKLLK